MRFRISPLSFLLATFFTASFAAAVPPPAGDVAAGAASDKSDAASSIASTPKIAAPEIPELDAENFWDTIKTGYWFVKHYSPTCPHCVRAAPVWQTLADFYMTSTPVTDAPSSPKSHPDSPSANPSFAEAYNFHFASLNCLAYGDICGIAELKISAWPTFSLYKDGKLVDQYSEPTNELKLLSNFVEKHLAEIKPGSRPVKIELPEVTVETKKKEKSDQKEQKSAEKEADATTPEVMSSEKEDTEAAIAPVSAAPKAHPNPEGQSTPLDADAFQRRITMTKDGWFVKFYAPWCGHCQAMAPAWAELGKEMKGLLNVGEVNCEVERRLCKDIKLRGYPTIMYFQNGEKVEYDGLRGLGDLVSYAKKAVDSGVKEVDLTTFETMEKQGELEVAFLYFYDHATVREDHEAIERLTLNLIGHAPLLKTQSKALAKRFRVTTWPRLIVIRDGRPSYYNALSPRDLRDYLRILAWMKSVWLPVVPELSAANSHEIMNNRLVVLGVLSRNRKDQFASAKKELKEAAVEFMDQRQTEEKNEKQELRDKKQLRIEEAEDRNDDRALREAKRIKVVLSEKKDVGFAWVDGVFWERWVKSTYGVDVNTDGERIIINDQDTKQYWDITLDNNPIKPSRSEILETLKAVIASPPKIRSKSTSSRIETLIFQARAGAGGHPWMTLAGVAGVIGALAYLGKRRRGGGGGWLKLDGKDGILGGNGQAGGKFD